MAKKPKEKLTMMEIEDFKNGSKNLSTFSSLANEAELSYLLEHLGRLNNGTLQEHLLALLDHKSDSIKVLAIKNLAKLVNFQLAERFFDIARNSTSTDLRREATSALGRLRNEKCVDYLETLAQDKDPKVVLQAIRGLLYFKDHQNRDLWEKEFSFHPNEQVRDMALGFSIQSSKKKSTRSKKEPLVPNDLKNLVIHGDTIDAMKLIKDESIQLTFTSPPYYNARDYSIYASYEEYLAFLQKVFEQVYRITQEGRFVVVNTSPVIVPRVSRAHSSRRYPIPYDMHHFMTQIGWEYIDDIVWLKPEASVKNRVGGFMQHRKPLGYKPNTVTETLMVYRKKTDKLIDWNMDQYDDQVVKRSLVEDGFESTNVWRVDPKSNKIHSAIFPIELCNRVISYYSYVEDIIFDPFAGSGTLGVAAVLNDRNFLLTEQDDRYFDYIVENLSSNKLLKSYLVDFKYLKIDEFRSLMT
jgi:DNA modification methylase